MDAGLKIQVGADVQDAVDGYKRVEQAGDNFARKTTQSTQLARYAVLDLGHTIRDLPYAMSNPGLLTGPIDRVAQLFTEITQQGGGAKAALSSIGQVLSGPGGILIGFELITTAATLFFGRAREGAKESKDTIEDFLASLKSAEDITLSATGGEQGNIDRVRALAAAIQDTNKSYKERQNALEELRETNKAYFGDLTLEADSLKTLAARVNEYSNALISEAVVKGQVDAIAKVSSQLEEQVHILDKLKDARDRAINTQQTTKITATGGGIGTVGGTNISQEEQLAHAVTRTTDAYNSQKDIVFKLREQIATYRGELDKAIEEQLKFKPLKDDGSTEKLKSVVPILQEIKRIYDELTKPSKEPLFKQLAQSVDPNTIKLIQAQIAEAEKNALVEGAKDPSGQIGNAYRDLAKALGAKLSAVQNPDLHTRLLPIADIDDKELQKFREESGKLLTDRMHRLPPIKSDIHVQLVFTDFERYQQDYKKKLDKLQKNLVDDVRDFTRAIQEKFAEDIGKAFGDALTGKGIKNAFNDFMEFLGSSIQKLGEELITASGVFSAVDVALNNLLQNPALAAAAGIAAVAVGEVIKNSFKATPFATGGIVTGPTVGLIGEAGPEVVFPLNQLNRFMKNNTVGAGQNINVKGVVSGRNLSLVMARDSKNQGLV